MSIYIKKTCIQSLVPLTCGGGGLGLDFSANNAIFLFDVFPSTPFLQNYCLDDCERADRFKFFLQIPSTSEIKVFFEQKKMEEEKTLNQSIYSDIQQVIYLFIWLVYLCFSFKLIYFYILILFVLHFKDVLQVLQTRTRLRPQQRNISLCKIKSASQKEKYCFFIKKKLCSKINDESSIDRRG